ncbi:MAG: 50S ribosomal protein L18 [Acholeplasmatales bacterium]|jgi:large subunit ribosomal protein L18|nr:50S ribosomal protein L18 [Acholeplasmatales bacterium]
MINKVSKNASREKRHLRIRQTLKGTAEKPRLSVFRSNSQIYAQIIDDVTGKTLCSASSLDKELKLANGSNVAAATEVGTLVAKRALALKIETVVFDRGGYLFHGRVKALADAARAAGLKF